MSLLDYDAAEQISAKRRRYVLFGIAGAIVIALGLWYSFRYTTETHTVEHFMDAVSSGNFQLAYQIWKPHGNSYSYQDFLSDWGPNGYYGPVKSYQVESAAEPPKGGSGVIVTVEVSPYQPFPQDRSAQSGKDREVRLWVERSDKSISFPP